MALFYRKESLFNAPLGSILVHACNSKGVWGSGIAVEFKKRFPAAFTTYHDYCVANPNSVGKALITGPHEGYYIGCIITSEDFGVNRDAPPVILKNTEAAVKNLLLALHIPPTGIANIPIFIYSNKFNSGFFGVPWQQSEAVLKSLIGPTDWTIMDPEL